MTGLFVLMVKYGNVFMAYSILYFDKCYPCSEVLWAGWKILSKNLPDF